MVKVRVMFKLDGGFLALRTPQLSSSWNVRHRMAPADPLLWASKDLKHLPLTDLWHCSHLPEMLDDPRGVDTTLRRWRTLTAFQTTDGKNCGDWKKIFLPQSQALFQHLCSSSSSPLSSSLTSNFSPLLILSNLRGKQLFHEIDFTAT